MDILNLAFAVFILVGPILIGAYAALFSRRFTLDIYRKRKAIFKIDFTESDLKVGQVFVAAIGALVAVGSFIVALQILLR